MDILSRVKIRLPDAEEKILNEFISMVSDRLCLRLSEEVLPKLFESICVDAVVKAYRRIYYEGISSEGVANISTSFVEDILSEYSSEIDSYSDQKADKARSERIVKFL